MRWKRSLSAMCLVLAGTQAHAGDSIFYPCTPVVTVAPAANAAPAEAAARPTTPQTPQAPARPAEGQPDMTQPPSTNFGESSPGGTEQSASANPQMLGDSLSYTGGNVNRKGGSMTNTTMSTITTIGGIPMATVLSLNNATGQAVGAANGVTIPPLLYQVTVDPQGFITASVFNRGANGQAVGAPLLTSRSASPLGGTSIPASAVPGLSAGLPIPPGSALTTAVNANRQLTATVNVPGFGTLPLANGSVPNANVFTTVSTSQYTSGLPLRALGGSSFKTSDNDSPRPEDRAFVATGYFTRVLHSVRDVNFGGPAPQVTLTRQIFGFEKTFADGNASFELRAPFFQTHQDDGTSFNDFGDVTMIGKWAFVNEHEEDRDTVLTGGIALTVPSGPDEVIAGTSINPTIFQPFVGYLFGNRDMFVQGFSEIAISFSDTVPTVWFNDIGVDYFAYRGNGSITAIVPTLEAHLTTAFGHQGSQALPVGVIDALVLTGGIHVAFAKHALITFGYEFPVTGPQPFESEYVMQFNYRF